MAVSSLLFHHLIKVLLASTPQHQPMRMLTRSTGGELAVSHAKQEITFDWSTVKGETQAGVKWTAFYSDYEHEVYEVTAGYRVTLTYNPFITRGAGHLAGATSALDPRQLPLFDIL